MPGVISTGNKVDLGRCDEIATTITRVLMDDDLACWTGPAERTTFAGGFSVDVLFNQNVAFRWCLTDAAERRHG